MFMVEISIDSVANVGYVSQQTQLRPPPVVHKACQTASSTWDGAGHLWGMFGDCIIIQHVYRHIYIYACVCNYIILIYIYS